jgi:hypothetical protein
MRRCKNGRKAAERGKIKPMLPCVGAKMAEKRLSGGKMAEKRLSGAKMAEKRLSGVKVSGCCLASVQKWPKSGWAGEN